MNTTNAASRKLGWFSAVDEAKDPQQLIGFLADAKALPGLRAAEAELLYAGCSQGAP